MLKMRMQRIGRKNQPEYRVIVTDSKNPAKRGRSVDLLGSYQPKLGTFQVDADKVKHWLSVGVQPSDTVYNFLVSQKLIEGKKKNVLPRKSPVINEEKLKAEAEAKAAAEAKAREEEAIRAEAAQKAKEREEAEKAAEAATAEAPKAEEVAPVESPATESAAEPVAAEPEAK